MKQKIFYHVSDTLADGDTTVLRIATQYRLILSGIFGRDESEYRIEYLESPVGESSITGLQCIALLEKLENDANFAGFDTVICVNNASRAKHINTGNAKGSACLFMELKTLKGNIVKVAGVDDEVFEQLYYYPGLQCLSFEIIHGITIGNMNHDDISQGSQFRSLEFRPLVQCILTCDKPKISCSLQRESMDAVAYFGKNIVVESDDNQTVLGYRNQYTIPSDPPLLRPLFQKIQLLGQQQLFNTRRGTSLDLVTSLPGEEGKQYQSLVDSLGDHEIMVVDRDHFGNTKCISRRSDGIHGLSQSLGVDFGEKVTILGEDFHDECYIVKSISDKTGQQCMRNGSSRTMEGGIFVELNRSFGLQHQKREHLSRLSIGDILVIQKK